MKILVIGVNTRHIACSASRAGYTVYSLSNFNDLDLKNCTDRSITQDIRDVHNLDLDELVPSIRSLLPVDQVVLGPGFEHQQQWMDRITKSNVPILNNPSRIMRNVSDKLWLSDHLKAGHIPHPFTAPLESLSSPLDWTKGYPAILKPRYGAGGVKNILITDPGHLGEIMNGPLEDCLLQEYINGTIVSISLISTGDRAVVLALNEQLAGIQQLTEMPFAYCGNITPYTSQYDQWLADTAIRLVLDLGLVGSNGVDFIITDKGPVVLEINPRFQGSIDTVELATGLNIFQAHYQAFQGRLPALPERQGFSIKVIYFAPGTIIINKKIYYYLEQCMLDGNAVDVPPEGARFEVNDPVISFIASGSRREEVVQKAKYLVNGLIDQLDSED